MANLKNINFMSQDTFESIEQVDDELYAVKFGFMPDYSAGVNINLPYTAPFNGFLMVHFTFNSGETYLYVNNVQVQLVGGGASAGMDYMIPVSKGDNITRSTTSTYNNGVFYPLKGVN